MASVHAVWSERPSSISEHSMDRCRGMAHPVNENRYAVAHTYALSCPKKKATGACPLHPGHRMAPEQASVDVLALFHYATRSLEDFRIKQSRGGGVNKMPKPQGFYDYWARCATSLPAALPSCRFPIPKGSCGLRAAGDSLFSVLLYAQSSALAHAGMPNRKEAFATNQASSPTCVARSHLHHESH